MTLASIVPDLLFLLVWRPPPQENIYPSQGYVGGAKRDTGFHVGSIFHREVRIQLATKGEV
jgi:hypothetical protein